MKKLLLTLLTLTALIDGCKYKDGPMISFRSVEKRLDGTWQVIEYTSNGIDSLQNFKDSCGYNMKIHFPPDYYNIDISFYTVAGNNSSSSLGNGGRFHFSNNNKIMYVDFNKTSFKSIGPIGGGESKWEILKLTMTKFKISTDFNGRNYLISFKKQ